jgi:uncharacterized protein (UPF0335 family)
MLKKIDFILLSLATLVFAQAKDYEVDKNGNVNINVIDRKVIVNGKVVRTIPKDEPIEVKVENTGASIDKDKLKANVGKDIGAKIDGDNISANVGDIGAKIEGGAISVNIGSILKKRKKDKDEKKEEDDFFGGDFFGGDSFFK